MSDSIQEIYDKIYKNFPEDKEKANFICTLLGTSGNLTQFVMEKHHPSEIPLAIQYSILITSMNMMGLFGDGLTFEKVDLGEIEDDFKISEQGQEHIYRKMKRAVDLIVEQFKKMEAENEL